MSIDPILAALADISTRLERLGAGQSRLEASLERLDSGQSRFEASLERLDAGQSSLERGVERLDAEQTGLRADLMARLDRLQSRVDQTQQEWFVAYAQGEAVRRHGENTRTEIRDLVEELSGLMRQVRMLRARVDQLENGKEGAS